MMEQLKITTSAELIRVAFQGHVVVGAGSGGFFCTSVTDDSSRPSSRYRPTTETVWDGGLSGTGVCDEGDY